MSEIERKQMLKIIEISKKKLKNNKSESVKFLSSIGMLTKTGKLKRDFIK